MNIKLNTMIIRTIDSIDFLSRLRVTKMKSCSTEAARHERISDLTNDELYAFGRFPTSGMDFLFLRPTY